MTPSRGRRILMAEDNEINAEIAIEILGENGRTGRGCKNGRLAVEAFKSSGKLVRSDLMDVQMPEMDGRTAARTIRALDRRGRENDTDLRPVGGRVRRGQRLSIQSGMNGHFAKPVDFTMLQQAIGVYLAKRKKEVKGVGLKELYTATGAKIFGTASTVKTIGAAAAASAVIAGAAAGVHAFTSGRDFYAGRRRTRDTHQSGAL